MMDCLIGGTLHGAPKPRVSQSGKSYVTLVVRASTRDGNALFVNAICFNTHVNVVLLTLTDGDSICIAGELSCKAYINNADEPAPSLDLLIHQVLTAYSVTHRRAAIAKREADRSDSEVESDVG